MEKKPTMLFVVAVALVRDDGSVFIQKRPKNKVMTGLWEFPGGKVEEGEAPAAALARELSEELEIEVDPADLSPFTFASEPIDGRNLLLLLYLCETWKGEIRGAEGQEIAWATIEDIAALPMPPADAPFIPALENYFKQRQ